MGIDPVTLGLGAASALGGAYGAHQQGKAAERQANAKTTLYDPTNPILRPLAEQQTNFLQGVTGGADPFAGRQNPLQTQAQGALQQTLQQPTAQAQAVQQINPMLQQLVGMQNPFAATQGVENPGANVVAAAQPMFEQNLRQANAQLAAAAPGRFSSAFAQQGIDLGQRALQDFNLFSAQQLAQGEALRAQQQQAAQQFMLGSGAQSLQALQQMMGNADTAQQSGFNQLATALGLGLQGTQQTVNPLLQLITAGLSYGAPSDLNAIVGGGGFANGGNVAIPGQMEAQQAARERQNREALMRRNIGYAL